jgi:uncharacterized hydrophobic protein (TIGR00271 family)
MTTSSDSITNSITDGNDSGTTSDRSKGIAARVQAAVLTPSDVSRPKLSAEELEAMANDLFFDGPHRVPYLWRFGALMFLATAVASLGLVADSGAVVIGAMLIAPLMTPMLAMATALVRGWPSRELEQLAIVAAGVVIAVATGFAISMFVPHELTANSLPAQISSRTNPSLVDLAIAIAAGAAGGYVTMRRQAGGALPGVGIAVALVPPLGAVGITWELGLTGQAWGAFLLFTTNLVAIVLSAGIVFALRGLLPPDELAHHRGRLLGRFAIIGVILAAIAVPLAGVTKQALQRNEVVTVVNESVAGTDLQVLDVTSDIDPDLITVAVILGGPDAQPDPAQLAADLAERLDRSVELDLRIIPETRTRTTASN